jgi:hypothetical protein
MRLFNNAWPHSAFCCHLSNDFLLVLALCQLQRLSVVEWDNLQRAAVNYDKPELQAFFREGCRRIGQLGRLAGMVPDQVRARQKAFVTYFGRRLCRPGS